MKKFCSLVLVVLKNKARIVPLFEAGWLLGMAKYLILIRMRFIDLSGLIK